MQGKKKTLRGKSILVTGGAGFIGGHLVERLVKEAPSKIVIVDNLYLGKKLNLAHARSILKEKLVCYWEDASDEVKMGEIIEAEEVDVVYDLAVIPLPASLEDPFATVMENVKLTSVLCELQRKGAFETLVHFSSSETYGTAQFVPITEEHPLVQSTPYAASKSAGDLVVLSYAHTFGLDSTILRPFNNYGPRQNEGNFAGIIPIVVEKVRQNEPILVNGDGLQTRDYIYVTDTADAAVQMYLEPETRGKVINIGSGEEISVLKLIDAILGVMGKPDFPVVHGPDRAGDVRRHMAGTKLAEKLINFQQAVDIETGMKATVEWYLDQPLSSK